MEWYEVAFDRMYPVLYGHRDIEEAVAVLAEFADLFRGRSPILDLASGNGRYLEALLRRGFDAFGLDLSHYLLRSAAEEWGHSGRLVQGDMRHLPFLDRSVDGVLNMFTSFGYFSIDTDNLCVFREVSRILKPGGVFLFDFLNSEKISADLLGESHRKSGDFEIRERKRIDSHGKYLVKEARISNPETGQRESVEERLRLYTKNELLTMFGSVGLHVKETCGDYSRNPFVPGVSERVIVIAEK